MMNSAKTRILKNSLLALMVIVVVVAGVFGWRQYSNSAPKRVSANFINFISKQGNDPAAYKLTTASYQQTVPFQNFVKDFQPLDKSQASYTIIKMNKTGNHAVTNGLINDLNGANYKYLIDLASTSSGWKVQAVAVVKE